MPANRSRFRRGIRPRKSSVLQRVRLTALCTDSVIRPQIRKSGEGGKLSSADCRCMRALRIPAPIPPPCGNCLYSTADAGAAEKYDTGGAERCA